MHHGQALRLSFALPLLSLIPSSDPGGRHQPPTKTSHDAQSRTPATDALAPDAPLITTRLQKARLRLHLLQLQRQERRNATTDQPTHQPTPTPARPLFPAYMQNPFASATSKAISNPTSKPTSNPTSKPTPNQPQPPTPSKETPARSPSAKINMSAEADKPSNPYTSEERRARSERLRARWQDPEWRAAILAKRRSKESIRRKSDSMKELWRDDAWRAKMREARLGRPAPNKGVPASSETRMRMGVAHKGIMHTPESKIKMSQAKRNRPPGDEWRRLISESKKGKTREYFAMRREFRALHRDLKLWSDSYRVTHGRLPSAMTYERFVAPIMVLRIRRYLMLRETLGQEEVDLRDDIMA